MSLNPAYGDGVDLSTVIAKDEFVDFWIDKNGNDILETNNAPGTMGTNSRIELAGSSIDVPNGDTWNQYEVVMVQIQAFYNSKWGETGMYGGFGVHGGENNNTGVVFQTGISGLSAFRYNIGGVHSALAAPTSLHVRAHLVGIKI